MLAIGFPDTLIRSASNESTRVSSKWGVIRRSWMFFQRDHLLWTFISLVYNLTSSRKFKGKTVSTIVSFLKE